MRKTEKLEAKRSGGFEPSQKVVTLREALEQERQHVSFWNCLNIDVIN